MMILRIASSTFFDMLSNLSSIFLSNASTFADRFSTCLLSFDVFEYHLPILNTIVARTARLTSPPSTIPICSIPQAPSLEREDRSPLLHVNPRPLLLHLLSVLYYRKDHAALTIVAPHTGEEHTSSLLNSSRRRNDVPNSEVRSRCTRTVWKGYASRSMDHDRTCAVEPVLRDP